jgi:hypothetical protein
MMHRTIAPLLLALLLLYLGYAPASGQDIVTVTPEQKITVNIADLPLRQVLELLSKKVPLEVQGNAALGERLTLHVSELTLQETLKEILTGYNYVLIRPEEQGKLVLVVLGRAEKGVREATRSTPQMGTEVGRAAAVSGEASPPPAEVAVPSPITAPSQPAQPPPTAPLATPPKPPATGGEGQAAAAQLNPSPDASTSAAPTADSQPPFNPAAWGGPGQRGSGRK